MNKKILSSCLALALFATALAPVYNQLSLSNNKMKPVTEVYDQTQEKTTEIEVLASEILDQKKSVAQISTDAVKSASTQTTVAIKKAAPSSSKAVINTTKKTATRTTVTKPKTVSTSKTTLSSRGGTRNTAVKPKTTTRITSTSTASSSKASAIISTAKSLLGVPYVWGGTTPSGFDCSGFTSYVLKKHGISIPRTAAEQYTVGTSVSKNNLKIGDLVFFTTYKAGPSHLGFYMGDGKFIHASSSKGVTISSLNSSYYASRYIGARRVIN